MTLSKCIRAPLIAILCLLWLPAANAQTTIEHTGVKTPNQVLRSARSIYIHSSSVYFKASTLENSLLQNEEFQGWNIAITRDREEADLVIEVGRKVFTTSFIYSVIDTGTNNVVASGRVNSVGSTVEHRISEGFLKKLRTARM